MPIFIPREKIIVSSAEEAAEIVAKHAESAAAKGTFGVGGVLIDNTTGEVIAMVENHVLDENGKIIDPTAHAERQLVDWYFEQRNNENNLPSPESLTIVSSLDPCMMCCSACIGSGFNVAAFALDESAGVNYGGEINFQALPEKLRNKAAGLISYIGIKDKREFQGSKNSIFAGQSVSNDVAERCADAFSRSLNEVKRRGNNDFIPLEELKNPAELPDDHPLKLKLRQIIDREALSVTTNYDEPDDKILKRLEDVAQQGLKNNNKIDAVSIIDTFGNVIMTVTGQTEKSPIRTAFMEIIRTYSSLRAEFGGEYLPHPKYLKFVSLIGPGRDEMSVMDFGAFCSIRGDSPETNKHPFQFVTPQQSQKDLIEMIKNLPPRYSSDDTIPYNTRFGLTLHKQGKEQNVSGDSLSEVAISDVMRAVNKIYHDTESQHLSQKTFKNIPNNHASNTLPIKISFVCTGNVCRSPMTQFLMQRILDEEYGEGVFEFSSAGAHDLIPEEAKKFLKKYMNGDHLNKPMTKTGKKALEEMGYYKKCETPDYIDLKIDNKKSQPIDSKLFENVDVVFSLGKNISDHLQKKFDQFRDVIFHITDDRSGIPDPYDCTGFTEEEYKEIFKEEYEFYFPDGHYEGFTLKDIGGERDKKVGNFIPAYIKTIEIIVGYKDKIKNIGIRQSIIKSFENMIRNEGNEIDVCYGDKVKLQSYIDNLEVSKNMKIEDVAILLAAIMIMDNINGKKISKNNWANKFVEREVLKISNRISAEKINLLNGEQIQSAVRILSRKSSHKNISEDKVRNMINDIRNKNNSLTI